MLCAKPWKKNLQIKYKMFALALLLILDAYILMQTPTSSPGIKVIKGDNNGQYIVYGTMKCGWTRKQLDLMKSKKINHTFVDCEKNPEKCKGMSAYPVVQMPSGEKKIGFQEV